MGHLPHPKIPRKTRKLNIPSSVWVPRPSSEHLQLQRRACWASHGWDPWGIQLGASIKPLLKVQQLQLLRNISIISLSGQWPPCSDGRTHPSLHCHVLGASPSHFGIRHLQKNNLRIISAWIKYPYPFASLAMRASEPFQSCNQLKTEVLWWRMLDNLCDQCTAFVWNIHGTNKNRAAC